MPLWTLEDSLHLGEIIKPHSYLGSVKVAFLFNGMDKVIKPKKFIFIKFMDKPVPFLIESVTWTSDDSANIKFADINSDKDADELRGRQIFIPSSEISAFQKKKMLDPSTFEGFRLQDAVGNELGIVDEIDEEGYQALLLVNDQGNQYMVPVHEDIILEVLQKQKILIVNLPEGLRDF